MTQIQDSPTTAFRPYAEALLRYGKAHPDVLAVSADLTASCEVDLFRDAVPERFVNIGMAEANAIGIIGGLAKEGWLPLFHTFGVFATRRCYDQVCMAIGARRARVRLLGFLPGLTTPGGPTHQAIDDVALMRSVPGMSVVDLGDATEISTALDATHEIDGPVYFRVMRGEVPVMFDSPLEFGRSRLLSSGDDLCLLSSSIITSEAARAAEALVAQGVSVEHRHVSTLKPFTDEALVESISRSRNVVVAENHLRSGGLGSAVAEVIAEHGLNTRLTRLGVPDRYARGGTLPYLLDQCGISAHHIAETAARALGLEADLGGLRGSSDNVEVVGDAERQEAL